MASRMFEWVAGIERALGALPPAVPPAARLRDHPHVPIASAIEGDRVRIVGRVIAGGRTLRSPLSDRECVLWQVSIDRIDAPSSSPIRRVHEVVPFDVQDDSGVATVRTESFAGWSVRDARSDGASPIAVPRARVLAFLDELEIPHGVLAPSLRLREGTFEIGEEIAVDARAHWGELEADAPASAGLYRASARARRLLLVPDPDDPVCASDDPEGPY